MRNITIPQLIPAQGFSTRQKLVLLLAVLLALLLHIMFYLGAVFAGFNPLALLLPVAPPPPQQDDVLQFVIIDDQQINEQLPDELKPKMRGRANRISRGEVIDPSLPKTGPSGKDQSPINAFSQGAPIPNVAGAKPTKSSPQSPPRPAPQPPVEPMTPTRPEQPVQPVKQPVKEPVKPKESEPISKILKQSAPELDTDLDVPGILPEYFDGPRTPDKNPQKSKFTEKQDAPKELENQKIAKTRPAEKPVKPVEKPVEKTEPQKQVTPQTVPKPTRKATQVQKPVPAVPKTSPPTRKIPTRTIGEKPHAFGGKMTRQHSSAMLPGKNSMAILQDRYGEYMDRVLRRIQESILIQQQLAPFMFQHGAVVMTFTVNAQGKLSEIKYIKAFPKDMAAETAAARRVLEDVASGKPFPPPTAKMLADPEFQKITINFIFDQQ